MLILITALAIFFGYSQSRRRQIFQASKELEKYGYIVDLPNDWRDYIWQGEPEAESFSRKNRDLLLLDLEGEPDASSPIHSLAVFGFTPAVVREMERARELKNTQDFIKRIEQSWAGLTPSARSSELQSRYMTMLNDARTKQAELESRTPHHVHAD
jgi:hypothetical protein